MAIIIFLGVFGGQYLDDYLELKNPWGTIVLSLLGVFISLYIVIKEVIKFYRYENLNEEKWSV